MTERWTFDEVARYLEAATAGLVTAAPGDAPPMDYLRRTEAPAHFVPTPPRPAAPDQDRFRFDAAAFTAREGAPDFLTAKRRYYARLPWSDSEQAHALPYSTPAAWATLNHPPIKRLDGALERWVGPLAGPAPDADPRAASPFFDPAFQQALDVGGSALTHGNRTKLLANGDSFREKLRLIADARQHLYIAVMFWACDSSADQLTAALAERVRAGVDVRVMTEGLYRETVTRRCIDRLEAAGVRVLPTRDALRRGSYGAVLHWKVWIRDGEEMILGGQNVGDYENRSTGFNFLDRDNDVRVQGPTVTDAEAAWIDAWAERRPGPDAALQAARAQGERARAAQTREGLRGAARYADWLGDPASRMDGNCRVLMQGVGARTQPIGPVVQAYLGASRRQVVLSSPTVRYDPDAPTARDGRDGRSRGLTIDRLMRALRTGDRRVIVITNGVGGGMGESQTWLRARRDGALRARQWGWYRLTRQFTELYARRSAVATRAVTVPLSATPGLEVWTYFQYIHTKIWLFDRMATMVGSWNLELNSTDKNPEAAIVCLDAGLRDAVTADLALALVNAVPEAAPGPQR